MPSDEQVDRLTQAVERLTQVIEGLRIDLAETFEPEPEVMPQTSEQKRANLRERLQSRGWGPLAAVAAFGLLLTQSRRVRAAFTVGSTGVVAVLGTLLFITPEVEDGTAGPQPTVTRTATPTPTISRPTPVPTRTGVQPTPTVVVIGNGQVVAPMPTPVPTSPTPPVSSDDQAETPPPPGTTPPTIPPTLPPTTTGPPVGGGPDCVLRVVLEAGVKVRVCVEA